MAKYVYYSTNFPFGDVENQAHECIKKRHGLELVMLSSMRCQTRLSYSRCWADIEMTQLSFRGGRCLGIGSLSPRLSTTATSLLATCCSLFDTLGNMLGLLALAARFGLLFNLRHLHTLRSTATASILVGRLRLRVTAETTSNLFVPNVYNVLLPIFQPNWAQFCCPCLVSNLINLLGRSLPQQPSRTPHFWIPNDYYRSTSQRPK